MIAAHAPAAAHVAAAPKTDKTLKADLVRLAKAAGGSGGFTVIDDRTGRTVAASDPDTSRPLGSTAKLLTTGLAAATFTPPTNYLNTSVETSTPVGVDGTLDGDLFLVGVGDPLMGEAQLQTLADGVQRAGIRTISGSIVGDGSRFDDWVGGPSTHGAFDLNMNGSIGALTYARGREAPDGPLQPDPARAAAFRFDDVLEARGVVIRGTPRQGIRDGSRPFAFSQTPVSAVIEDINKRSDDFAAEMLAKIAAYKIDGTQATTARAATDIAAYARTLHTRFRVVDGSGVDRRTSGAPRQLARYVRAIRRTAVVARSLPIAGVDGTLADRMTSAPARGNCHAKTGSLPQSRDSALAGWCRVHGRTLVFAIQRTHVTSQPAAKDAEDTMVERIAASRPR